MFMAPMSQRLRTRRSKILLNRVGRIRNQIVRFEIKLLLFDNDESTTYKEAMMSPDSIDWLEAMKIRDKSIYEKTKFLNLEDPLKGMKPINRIWIYK